MPDSVRRFLKVLLVALVVILVAGIASAFWARGQLRASLWHQRGEATRILGVIHL